MIGKSKAASAACVCLAAVTEEVDAFFTFSFSFSTLHHDKEDRLHTDTKRVMLSSKKVPVEANAEVWMWKRLNMHEYDAEIEFSYDI